MPLNFQHRSTVALSHARNRRSSTRSLDARLFTGRSLVAPNVGSVRTSRSWRAISARWEESNIASVKYCRATSPTTRSVSRRVFAQGQLALSSSPRNSIQIFISLHYREGNEPAKFTCSKSDCGVSSFRFPGCINVYGDLNECCSTSIVCGKINDTRVAVSALIPIDIISRRS